MRTEEVKRVLRMLKANEICGEGWLKSHGMTSEDLNECVDDGLLVELQLEKEDTLWKDKKYQVTKEGRDFGWKK